MSTPGKSKRCTANRAISSSVRRRRIGTLSKLRREATSRRGSSTSSAASTPIFTRPASGEHADLHQAGERRVDVGHALAHELELESGAVLGKHGATAIEDESALCGQ